MPSISPALLPLFPASPIPSPLHGRSPLSTPGTLTPLIPSSPTSPSSQWFLHPRPRRSHLTHPPPLPDGRPLTPPQNKVVLKMVGPWRMGESLGRGTSGAVRLARHTGTGEYGAVKVVPKSRGRESVSVVEREVGMLKVARHPYLIALHEVFETEHTLYLVTEYCAQGELFAYLVKHEVGQDTVHRLFCQLVSVLSHLATLGIAHRDLKLENLLLSLTPEGDLSLKLADLGMARPATRGMMETSCGSPHYAAPEVIRGLAYSGLAADVWSAGVILYALLARCLPFDDEHIPTLLELIKRGLYKWTCSIPHVARDLIDKMLCSDVPDRISIFDVAKHEFVVGRGSSNAYDPLPEELVDLSPTQISDLLPRTRAQVDPIVLHNLLILFKGRTQHEMLDAIFEEGAQSRVRMFYAMLREFRFPLKDGAQGIESEVEEGPFREVSLDDAMDISAIEEEGSISVYSTHSDAEVEAHLKREGGVSPTSFLTHLTASFPSPPPSATQDNVPPPLGPAYSAQKNLVFPGPPKAGSPRRPSLTITPAPPSLEIPLPSPSALQREVSSMPSTPLWPAGSQLSVHPASHKPLSRAKKVSLHKKIKALFATKKDGVNLRPSSLSTPAVSEEVSSAEEDEEAEAMAEEEAIMSVMSSGGLVLDDEEGQSRGSVKGSPAREEPLSSARPQEEKAHLEQVARPEAGYSFPPPTFPLPETPTSTSPASMTHSRGRAAVRTARDSLELESASKPKRGVAHGRPRAGSLAQQRFDGELLTSPASTAVAEEVEEKESAARRSMSWIRRRASAPSGSKPKKDKRKKADENVEPAFVLDHLLHSRGPKGGLEPALPIVTSAKKVVPKKVDPARGKKLAQLDWVPAKVPLGASAQGNIDPFDLTVLSARVEGPFSQHTPLGDRSPASFASTAGSTQVSTPSTATTFTNPTPLETPRTPHSKMASELLKRATEERDAAERSSLAEENASLRSALSASREECEGLKRTNRELMRHIERMEEGQRDFAEGAKKLLAECGSGSAEKRLAEGAAQKPLSRSTSANLTSPPPTVPSRQKQGEGMDGRPSEEGSSSGDDSLREMLEGLSYEAPGFLCAHNERWEDLLREEREHGDEEWEEEDKGGCGEEK